MTKQTLLYPEHIKAHGKMVDFAGWRMPLHYGSQLEEHYQVRKDAGVFDVSHMTVIDVAGTEAKLFLRYLIANDVAKLTTGGKALYGCMLNETGGVIDDLIIYYIQDDFYRMVVNAGTRDKDIVWIEQVAKGFKVNIRERKDMGILAIQGPHARAKVDMLFDAELQTKLKDIKPFQFIIHKHWLIARTGYTGEDGYEVILPNEDIITFWQKLLANQILPAGLGARDTLRLEAGLNLYGADMDETTSPLESNLGWTVAFEPTDRNFIGRQALETEKKSGIQSALIGLVLEERGVLRNHFKVKLNSGKLGEITSGSFSPTLNKAIALARIPADNSVTCEVEIRGKWIPARIVKPPFVRQGKILV